MDSPRILICGGRDYNDYNTIRNTLDDICWDRGWHRGLPFMIPNVVVIHGGARGADLFADQWAVVNWLEIEEYKADWSKYGKKAGGIRNQQMLDEGKPDLVIAFPTKQSRGTWDMVRRAKKAGVETIIIEA